MTPLAWLGILAILLVIEAITVGLTTVWFAGGALGKRAVVIQPINNLAQTGQVRINDIEWTARSADESVEIPAGAVVEIKEIRGVKLIVKEDNKEG